MKLMRILERLGTENEEKNLLNSNANVNEIKKFDEVCTRVMNRLKNAKTLTKEQLHTEDNSNNLYTTSMIRKAVLTHHLGEYNGPDFKGFTTKLGEAFERAGFKVRRGYGIDEIKGYEIIDEDKEVIGEIDFIEKGSVPNMGNIVVFKHKKL